MRPLLTLAALLLLLLPACTVAPPTVAARDPRPSTLVIVHGLYANSNHVRPLTDGLRAQGFTCFAPELRPNDGSVRIETLAEDLADYIDSHIPAGTPLQLVGHSMGGLVALQYLQNPAHAARCRGLCTIASPHQGTLLASLHAGAGARQMTTNSSYLKSLNARRPTFPVTTYRSSSDFVILPNSSSKLPYADNNLISSAGHNEILRSEELLQQLTQKIRATDERVF